MISPIFILLLVATPSLALYDAEDSAVYKLTEKNFGPQVLESEEFWLVEFYGN